MTYKILEALGVDNENIDGAALNWMASSGKNGILRGVLNECIFYQTTSTSAEIGTGELMIHGFRVKLIEPYAIEQPYIVPETTFSVIMGISLKSDRQVSLSITCEPIRALVKDDLFVTEQGLYEIEFGKITAGPSGIISLVRTVEPIVIGSSEPSEEEDEPVSDCVTEYDHEITEPSQFTTENLATMSGNILVKCDIEATEEDMSVTIPIGVKLINFNGHRTNYSITGHQDCRLISAVIGMGASSYETYMSNFASVEFCTGYGCFRNCSRIAHSSIWNAYNCSFITDVVTSTPESQVATFYQCSNITNVKVEDVSDESSMGVEFEECSNISNVTKYGSADGVVTYTNCKYVDALTCVGYGVGVPYVDANGIVSFLTNAEGGSYGS